MSTALEIDYADLVKKAATRIDGPGAFEKRMNHWVRMLEMQAEAFRLEDAKLRQVGGSISIEFDFKRIHELRDKSLAIGKFSYDVFDPKNEGWMMKFGEVSLSSHRVANRWSFYTGLRMSKNPDRNPAILARLEPTSIVLSPEVRLPSLTFLPDTIHFTDDWYFLEGTMQDFANAAILMAFEFDIRPSVKNVAQGLIAVLLSGIQI